MMRVPAQSLAGFTSKIQPPVSNPASDLCHLVMMTYLQAKFLLYFLSFCMLLACVTACPAQSKSINSKARPRYNNGIVKKKESPIIIRFDYYPPVGESGLVFVSISGNGEAKIVLYGPYLEIDSVTVHQGMLPKREVTELKSRIQKAISEWSPGNVYDDGFQDESIFHLSITSHKSSPFEIHYLGLGGAPRAVVALVDELRMLWKRLDKKPAGYAYIRSKSIKQKFQPPVSAKDAQGIPIQKFPRHLRSRIANAIKNPLDFHTLSRSQVKQLLLITSNQYLFSVQSKDTSHGLTLYVPPHKPPG